MRGGTNTQNGWKPFWAALGATLLVLLPLMLGTVLLTRRATRSRIQTAQPQSGIPVALPKATDQMTLLVCVASEQPGFVLLYLNAAQNCIDLLALPAETCVDFGGQDTALAQCYAAAGPARCREALLEPLALPEDTRYLALSPALLEKLTDRYGSFRVGFSGALTPEELAVCGRSNGVEGLSSAEAQSFLSLLDCDFSQDIPSAHRAMARAVIWDAFFRQNLEFLPTALPQALRENSSSLLTDLTAQDYYLLEAILEFLANNTASVRSNALPGKTDGAFYHLNEDSRAAVQTFFNVSPTSGQASSSSEP